MNAGLWDRLLASGRLAPIDVQFADLVARLSGPGSEEWRAAAALASARRRAGHVCLDLAAPGAWEGEGDGEAAGLSRLGVSEAWTTVLRDCPSIGQPGEFRPLILDGAGRLYLYRYWRYEDGLARRIEAWSAAPPAAIDAAALRRAIDAHLPPRANGRGATDLQRAAAAVAARRPFSVVSGGPGTGKTWTVFRLLAVLRALSPGRPPRVALAAPTGKAVRRLQDAIGAAASGGAPAPAVGIDASGTIHRLLRPIPGTPRFRHGPDQPLPYDVVVVDEASMVDVALMAKLVAAIPDGARLILLGDRDQLASVEAGSVLGDLCGPARATRWRPAMARAVEAACGFRAEADDAAPAAADGLVFLRETHRFGAASGLAELARRIGEGDAEGAWEALASGGSGDLGQAPLPARAAMGGAVAAAAGGGFAALAAAASPEAGMAALDEFRILCVHRVGPFGVERANGTLERRFGRAARPGTWYPGRPVVVNENDYEAGLFNGDAGLAWPGDGGLNVFFPAEGGGRRVHPSRLPAHETCYAMTVHKAQGSEFRRVLLILPDRASPILTRELLYTAVTRARERLDVWCGKDVFMEAVRRRVERSSGLRDALWGA